MKAEDYDRAKILKDEILSLRAQISRTLREVDQVLGAEIGSLSDNRLVGEINYARDIPASERRHGGYGADINGSEHEGVSMVYHGNIDTGAIGFRKESKQVDDLGHVAAGAKSDSAHNQFDPEAPVPAMRLKGSSDRGSNEKIPTDEKYRAFDDESVDENVITTSNAIDPGLRVSTPGRAPAAMGSMQSVEVSEADGAYQPNNVGLEDELDSNEPHPLHGVDGYEQLTAPEPLGLNAGTGEAMESAELSRLFGDYVVRCLYSDKWELRRAALIKIRLILPELSVKPDFTESAQSLCRVLQKGLEAEKNAQVVLCTMELAETCCDHFAGAQFSARDLQHKLDSVTNAMVCICI